MSDLQAYLVMSPSRAKALLPREAAQELRDIKNTKRAIVLDLAFSALAGRRYSKAIEQLSKFEGMIPSPTKLERVQVMYVKAMCYRGLGDAPREEALLKAAEVELEGLRRSVATRNASLRLRDLRQLIQEEYLSALYRRGDWTGMARAIAAYRLASLLPVAILAAAPRDPLAQELETLKDTYDALAAGAEQNPVTRQSYRELFKLFEQPERLPAGDPTLNAIEQATYLVTNELYAETPGDTRTEAVIRPAIPGELLILQSVGHTGLYTVTIDEHGHVSGYYRYMPIASLEALCQDFENALQAEGSSEAGTRLYDRLLAYLPEMKGKRRLSILADGPLQNLAWAALPTPDGRYLIEKYEIGILSGAKPAPGRGTALAREQILAITNPDSDVDAAGKLAAIGDGGRVGVIALEGAEATLPNIQRELTRTDAVYISTHGQSDYLRPDYSFLELASGRRLYSLDLGNLDFSRRRLLLSACETRTGKTYPGEEAYGLADAFLARNASTVVATRWRVEAPAANAFAAAFYGNLHDSEDYTTAATLAARSLLKSEEWRVARHWAAYEPVTRFLDSGHNPTRLTQGAGSQDVVEIARTVEALQGDRKQAEMERKRLEEKEAVLHAELTELGTKVTLEEDRNLTLSGQASAGRSAEKWIGAALKTAKSALKANPDWKPAERFQLTVRVKDESGHAVPGAVVSSQDVSLQAQITRSTDSEGNAVFPDMRAATPYKIDASAKGFATASTYNDELDVWFGHAEKVISMWRVNDKDDRDEEEQSPQPPKPKSATKKRELRKPPQVLSKPAGPLRILLEDVNRSEALNDAMAPGIAQLETERTKAKEALESKTREYQREIKQIDEYRAKIDEESRELNAILRQVHLTEVQPEQLEISGTVDDNHFNGIRAKVTLERVGAGVEETTSSDESGHFVLAGAKPGVEYVVAAEADGRTAWKSLPMSIYFPCKLFIVLRTPQDTVYRRTLW
jgi:CHAT domain-containing protein